MAASWRRTACQARKNPRSLTDTRMQLKYLAVTMTFQRTVTTPLTLCLNSGVHPKPLFLVLACCLPYPLERAERAFPTLSPERVAFGRVPLGQLPSLRRLRCRSLGLVRRLRRYCEAVRLPASVRHRRLSFDFPTRSAVL